MKNDCKSSNWHGTALRAALTVATVGLPLLAWAQDPATAPVVEAAVEAAKPDTGDTAWMMVSAALVMLMTPGLALFYGGMIRTKNVLNTLMQSFVALSVITILWVVAGYSFAFAPGSTPFYGGTDYLMLGEKVNQNVFELNGTKYTFPHQVFMMYQLMFAIITPALISGAIADRMKFGAYIAFISIWHFLVYVPMAHMVWGQGGYLFGLGALDFAGGLVVHITSGVSALVLAIMLGKRTLTPKDDTRPHNLPMTLIGTALLWFGWFGFNAGSAGASGGLAGSAFLVTHVAAATAGIVWIIIEWFAIGKPTALGFATGAVAGLVAITPASGFVDVTAALIIGAGVSFISYFAIKLKSKFGYDDTLDVFGVHAIGGIWGAIATGLFAKVSINAANTTGDGLLVGGGTKLIGIQLISVLIAVVVAVVGTVLIAGLLKAMGILRATEKEEEIGLDQTQHGEEAYNGMEGADGAFANR
ncbi:MAG: ammonium transporter [Armatimonadetes bacterium]|nr:ammonium transporter [Armatimonadota bacterium]